MREPHPSRPQTTDTERQCGNPEGSGFWFNPEPALLLYPAVQHSPVSESSTIAVYARVSTGEQDAQRQLSELREYVERAYPDHDVREFVDVVSGTDTDDADEYTRLTAAVERGEISRVVVDEISRLSRLGGGEVHRFIQDCLRADTSVEDREVGLSVNVDDDAVSQAVSELLVGLMGQLAKIEHKQKLRRIQSGIRSAQEAGKWTGRPPLGFTVDDGYLRVEPEEFLRCRAVVERVSAGETTDAVADDLGMAQSTVARLAGERRELYLRGDAGDERVSEAVSEIQPLPDTDADTEPGESFDERVRAVVREELQNGE